MVLHRTLSNREVVYMFTMIKWSYTKGRERLAKHKNMEGTRYLFNTILEKVIFFPENQNTVELAGAVP